MVERRSDATDDGLEGSRELSPDLGCRLVRGLPFSFPGLAVEGREKASISSRDSWVGAAILILTVLSSRLVFVEEASDALSLPTPPLKRVACLPTGALSGDEIRFKGTHGVSHSQQVLDWSKSHAQ